MSNILKVHFWKETQIVSSPLYQYDYGQKVRILGLDLPAYYEVHVSNYERGDATTVLASSNEFDIPDMYLQSGRDVYIWIYLHTGDSDGETEYQITIPVLKRAKPTDEEPTPEEQSIIDQTIIALNDAVTEARDISEDVTEKDEHITQLYTYMNNTKNEVYQYKEDAETAANLLKNVSANAETLPPSSDATATYSSGVFNFGIPKGEPGKNFVIQKYVATVEDLPSNVEVGTVYAVGTSQPYSIYVFSENLGWVDNGFVQGPQGLPGEKGEAAGFGTPTVTVNQTTGQAYASVSTRGPNTAKIFDFAFSGLKGEKGDTGNGISSVELNDDYTLTINYTDGTSYTTDESIRGDTGENGTTYMPSLTSDGILSWTNDGGKINPRSVNIKGPQGERGEAGQGIPTGGTTGQVLKKVSDTDFDTEWDDATGIPASNNPLMDGVATVGVSEKYAREDHVHPKDSSMLALDQFGTEFSSGDDLDNFITPGNYYTNDADITQSLLNRPSQVRNYSFSCKLIVLKIGRANSGNPILYQFYLGGVSSNATIYMRSRAIAMVWTEWVCLTEPTTVNGHTVQSDVPSNAVFTDTISSVYCNTASDVQVKKALCSNFVLQDSNCFQIIFTENNTYEGLIYLNINQTGNKQIYINGRPSGASNYTLPAGAYLVYYSGSCYYINTDGSLPVNDLGVVTCYSAGDSDYKEIRVSKNLSSYATHTDGKNLLFYIHFINANTYAGPLYIRLLYKNSGTALDLYINGEISSASNYTLPAGIYPIYKSGTKYDIRTDGKIPINISGNAATVNGHSVLSDVPANAVFTDTTYESKAATSGGTEVSLVTTGEKSTWNNKVTSIVFQNTGTRGLYQIKNYNRNLVIGMASLDQPGLMSADDYSRVLNSQPQPVKLKLISNSDYSYQDSPIGPFSVNTDYIGDISDIYLAQNVKLIYGTINLNSTNTPQYNEEYRLVSAANTNGETPVITLTFRTISMRNGTPVIKTVIVEQETGTYNLNNAIVTYSEVVL